MVTFKESFISNSPAEITFSESQCLLAQTVLEEENMPANMSGERNKTSENDNCKLPDQSK